MIAEPTSLQINWVCRQK